MIQTHGLDWDTFSLGLRFLETPNLILAPPRIPKNHLSVTNIVKIDVKVGTADENAEERGL